MPRFSEIVGQKDIKEELSSAIATGHVSHAYIFHGEPRSGKEFIARAFAQTLLCEKVAEAEGTLPEACDECHSCAQAKSRNHPDIIYVQHNKPNTIGVDDVREGILETVQIKPYSSQYKIYIMEEAEKMTPQAQNALLKTIEEPPAYAVFLLLTSSTEALLPTVLSRCTVLNMMPVPDEDLRRYLINEESVPENRAEICIAFARGNLGRAKAFANNEDFEKIRTNALSLMKNISRMDTSEIMNTLKEISGAGFDINDYLDIMAVWYRDILLFKATHDMNHLIFRDEISSIQKVAQSSDYEGIEEIIQALDTAKCRLRSMVDYELTMELLLLTIKENQD
ncbi:MAG: DNA polymerase III subunit tau [Firmicutes bacterium ADurb.Bin354]|nr:MAG: DNA polymerase III subunit tau [Firmicutes bacterium ADurb.Bin354]